MTSHDVYYSLMRKCLRAHKHTHKDVHIFGLAVLRGLLLEPCEIRIDQRDRGVHGAKHRGGFSLRNKIQRLGFVNVSAVVSVRRIVQSK